MLGWMQRMRDDERERTRTNHFLLRALEEEKREGQRIATVARTVALVVIALFLPFLNPGRGVLYYEAFILVFMAIGWAQLRVAQVGRSRTELALIFLDLALLTFIASCRARSPRRACRRPSATASMRSSISSSSSPRARSPIPGGPSGRSRTGSRVLWLAGLLGVVFLGHGTPRSARCRNGLAGYPTSSSARSERSADPVAHPGDIVFVLVAGILGSRAGARTSCC